AADSCSTCVNHSHILAADYKTGARNRNRAGKFLPSASVVARLAGGPMTSPIDFRRKIALTEGVSLLLLLFIAMPLQYLRGQPMAVRVVGTIHGILWVIFCATLLYVTIAAKWPLARAAVVFLAGLIPFGPWIVDRRMNEYAREFRR